MQIRSNMFSGGDSLMVNGNYEELESAFVNLWTTL
jgi:hypothetical protein